jgi:hypothetical protein
MREILGSLLGASISILAILIPTLALGQSSPQPLPQHLSAETLKFLLIVGACGGIGGVIYELVALQGNIEWPHLPSANETPEGGYVLAKVNHLFDLGILARVIIGAAAAVVIYWAIPIEDGVRLVAVSVVAGSAGTAVFRSLQDRLLAALNQAKVDTLKGGLKELVTMTDDIRQFAGDPADARAKVAEIRGRVQALLRVAGDH